MKRAKYALRLKHALRAISVLLILTLVFSVTGCSQKKEAGNVKDTPSAADKAGGSAAQSDGQTNGNSGVQPDGADGAVPDAGQAGDDAGSVKQTIDKEAAFRAEPASKRTIHIGYDGGLCQAAIPIAHHKGFFEAEGLKTELTRTGGTHDNVRDALAAGKIDTTAGMIAGWLKPITNGIDLKFTVGLHTGCASAFVLADSPIRSFADAKGKTIAINGGIGGVYHNIGYRFIAHDGFAPEDFIWRDFPADQTLLILQKGEADVAVFSDQLAEKWVQDGTLRRIRSLHSDEDFKNESCCVLGISGPFYAENPVTSEKISRAIYKASLWIGESDANKEEAIQILLDNDYISGTKEYALQLMKLFRWGLPNELTEATLELSITDYQKLGVISSSIDPAELKAQIWVPLDIE